MDQIDIAIVAGAAAIGAARGAETTTTGGKTTRTWKFEFRWPPESRGS